MKVSWLWWVRRAEGNISHFTKEAVKFGPAIKLPLKDIEKLSWGDQIYCVKKETGGRSGSVFLSFPVRILTGLSEEGRDALAEEVGIDEVMPGGGVVYRRGFSYTEAQTYSVNANVQEVAAALRKVVSGGADVGHLMIGCGGAEAYSFPYPFPQLTGMPVVQSLYQFDAPRFRSDVEENEMAGREAILPGLYAAELEPTKTCEGLAQLVENYRERRAPKQTIFEFASR